jgi:hypothetical protein
MVLLFQLKQPLSFDFFKVALFFIFQFIKNHLQQQLSFSFSQELMNLIQHQNL